MNGLFAASFVLPPNQLFFGVSPWVRHNRIHIIQRLGDTDFQFLVEVVLFGGEVEGRSEPPVFLVAESLRFLLCY